MANFLVQWNTFMSFLNLKCSQSQRNALWWKWKLAEMDFSLERDFLKASKVRDQKDLDADLPVTVYTQYVVLARERAKTCIWVF